MGSHARADKAPVPGRGPGTLVDHFREVFGARPRQRTFRFLVDGQGPPTGGTNAETDLRIRATAATLRQRLAPGDRVLILCPAGLDYVTSFLACLYAGVVAVPVYPPDPALLRRTLPRLTGVAEDARPAAVLASGPVTAMADRIAGQVPALRGVHWITPGGTAAAGDWRHPGTAPEDLAFLQYTSGSTGSPKGVMVTHANLIHNITAMGSGFFGLTEDDHMVTWLPPYHDMGLILGLLTPAFTGIPVTFMSPFAFLKHPVRWLRALSDHGGTVSGAPDFAYDLCASTVSEAEAAELDLSRWRLAVSGAEPVRPATLDRFARAFAPAGFRRRAFYPAYGLAESTLAVSGGDPAADPVVRALRAEALAEGRAEDAAPGERDRALVDCGASLDGQRIAVVDPASRERLPDGRVGEIWVRGPSVAQGYWQRPRESEETFAARLAPDGEGPFLRTGDLGFLDGGELYVTGRIKDLLIVAGRNHYPQDIERSVQDADPALRRHCGVAGTRESGGAERLIVVQEVDGDPEPPEADRLIEAVRARVAEDHGLRVDEVALVRRGQVPKTSSGKLRRGACLDAHLGGGLRYVATWSAAGGRPQARPAPEPAAAPAPAAPSPGSRRVESWLTERIAERTGIPARDVDPARPLSAFGLGSSEMVALAGELERWLGTAVPATAVWEHPTVEALARHFGGGRAATAAGGPGPAPARRPATRREETAEPVAIVGVGCRFPGGADSPEAFWRLLREGRDAVTEVPADRWDADAFHHSDPSVPGRAVTRWGGFLDRVDDFDPHFFGISHHEAARMDPQQRLLAEVAWEALEDAGIPADRIAGSSTGVFVGISTFDHAQRRLDDLTAIDAYTATGSALSIAANRLSYLFDLRGPSMAVDTACSSSLVAVVMACRSLARGEAGLALAGGVNLVLSPAFAINFTKAGVMSPDGRCKTFDARADGYVRSEGAGVVVLKPLGAALADGDPVYAVIRGGAVNQDGRSNGLMAPSPAAQEAVLRAAYAEAGVRPRDVGYAEAHGTGTALGDPIEAKALGAVLGEGRDPGRLCLVGSVKTNLGHMEAAAGIGGLIKAALAVRHRTVPPSLHFRDPNPHIPFAALGLEVAATERPWPTQDGPALAGVSSFGFGGTNAHVVVEEPPRPRHDGAADGDGDGDGDGRAHALVLSARTPRALRELAARHEARLAHPPAGLTPRALAFAAAVRRTHHEHRLACVGTTLGEFREALAAFGRGEPAPGLSWGERRPDRGPGPVFVFSGQGAQWWPVAADLAESEPSFRAVLERCDAHLRDLAGWSLLAEIAGGDGCRLREPEVGQPALFAVQTALAALWRSHGVEPAAVVGHSVGEIAAAHAAGALSLADGLRVALHRGRVIRAACGQGRMAVAAVPHERARRLLDRLAPGRVWVAAANSPSVTVFSGETAALERLLAALEADGVHCRLLDSVDFPSHCPLMEPVAAELRGLLADLAPRPARTPLLSTVTGEPAGDGTLDAGYWASNLTAPVLFDRAVTRLAEDGHQVFVEVSPHPMLAEAVAERLSEQGAEAAVVTSLRRGRPGRAEILGALGALYTAGVPLDFRRIHGSAGPMVDLPGYPWQKEPCRLEAKPARRPSATGHPVLETRLRSAAEPRTCHWSGRVDLTAFPYLRDHRVDGGAVLPAALLLDAALAAARQALGDARAVVEDVAFTRMTVVPETAAEDTLQLVHVPETPEGGAFRLYCRDGGEAGGEDGAAGGDWTEVAHGRFRLPGPAEYAAPAPGALAAARDSCRDAVDRDGLYAALAAAGLGYGPAFQRMSEVWRGERQALARLGDPPAAAPGQDPYPVHPALLDACLQALAAAVGADGPGATHLPVATGRLTLWTERAEPRWAHAVAGGASGSDGIEGCSVTLFDEDGGAVGRLDGVALRRLDRKAAPDPLGDLLLDLRWRDTADGARDTPAPREAGPGWWLLLADRTGLADRLGERLRERSGTCVTVTAGPGYRRLDGSRYELDPSRPEDVTALLDDLRATRTAPPAGVVHAWALDDTAPDGTAPDASSDGTAPDTAAPQDAPPWAAPGTVSALHLVQVLARADWDPAPPLVLLTRGAQRATAGDPAPALAQAPLWGLLRVAALEHGELRPRVVDLDPAPAPGEADRLLAELLRPGDDAQVALRGTARLVPRLDAAGPAETGRPAWERRPFDAERDGNHRVLALRPGVLDSLTPTLWRRTPPGPGQVEIEVTAAGLNFSDVLKALDSYPGMPRGESVPLGAECAGRVTAVGEGVALLRPGDPVMAVAPSGMAAFATTAAALAVRRPRTLTDEQAAAVPVAFLTALYGLAHLARLEKGETVLVHSATGGVGLAAIQVARARGAEVLATAGTEEKRRYLRELGVAHVWDSRTLAFADGIAELTGGRGVDVVLNSAAGEALRRSLALLAPGGRFVEIGKRDLYGGSHLDLGLLKDNRSLFAVDLERTFRERPEQVAGLLAEVARGFDRGEFTPLPVTGHPYARATAAFTAMARARHTGKLVLRPAPREEIAVPGAASPVRDAATYLVTGGLGGLGLETARYLADQGARHLVLAGRGEPSPEAVRAVAELTGRGVRVEVRRADVSRYADVAALVAFVDASMPPLAGVVHAAGVLDDGLLLHQDLTRYRAVAGPKAAGAWHLHRATAGRDLDFFVLYSSAAALLGSPGQGTYAAANAFLDALAQHRAARGLPALSVNWGPWSGVGLAARPDRGGALASRGVLSLSPRDGIAALDRLLRRPAAQACVLPLDRRALRADADSGLLPGLLTDLAAPARGGDEPSALRRELLAAPPGRRRRALLARHCREEAARVLKLDAGRVDPTAPLGNMGFDSLMSLELRNRLEASCRVALPATLTWRFPTIEALVPFLAERMEVALDAAPAPAPGPDAAAAAEPAASAPGGPPPAPGGAPEPDLDALSDSELEALLTDMTEQIDAGRTAADRTEADRTDTGRTDEGQQR
ncbi:hypothetical protein GCM10027168_49760 [Streptomyces capparidis]